MKKVSIIAAVLVLAVAGGFYVFATREPERTYKTAPAERGDIVATVSATGNLSAVTTVQVGTQVSGTIQRLFVDFNSPVKKGEVIAQIDPALFSAEMEQTRGNSLAAQANLAKARATAVDAKRTMARNRQLVKDGVVSQGDFDTAETRYEESVAAVKAAEATVVQTRGALARAETNLKNATIRSPVDGVVISRSVDVGQTVAASFQTPTLFTIAQDLTRMQIETSVDEADISRVRVGQPVSFTVDAYPDTPFKARVAQVRNAPVVTQNVVTYVVVITVANPDLKLKPGMTANVAIEVGRKDNVLKVPKAALRYKPRSDKEESDEPRATGRPAGMKGKQEGGQQVFVLSAEKKPVPVKIATGLGNDSHVEVASGGLKEGDKVIVQESNPKEKQKKSGGGPPMRF
ncbi:efflux RND transporter periplasmic adaptor subunit [Geobacter sp.]|uniref:efflux RND transporter periplasmic adaptor subunit n=1 Tax=Geobacter sp. TaxID=46610 RepID=UPI0027B9B6A3|nr:efflux RND transporter periplasmic adaptor subunit [Geobacter sp.]